MLSQSKYAKGKGKLSHLKLTTIEWSLLEDLLPMLQVSQGTVVSLFNVLNFPLGFQTNHCMNVGLETASCR